LRKREEREGGWAKRAAKAIQVDRNKRRIALYERGKAARKQERARKARIKALRRTGQLVPVELTILIRDPEKNPTPEDLESLEPHPSVA
jgi:hypothetical protein